MTIFDVIDTNGDGSIGSDELYDYYSSFGAKDKKFSDDVFNAIDLNKDGTISQEGIYMYF